VAGVCGGGGIERADGATSEAETGELGEVESGEARRFVVSDDHTVNGLAPELIVFDPRLRRDEAIAAGLIEDIGAVVFVEAVDAVRPRGGAFLGARGNNLDGVEGRRSGRLAQGRRFTGGPLHRREDSGGERLVELHPCAQRGGVERRARQRVRAAVIVGPTAQQRDRDRAVVCKGFVNIDADPRRQGVAKARRPGGECRRLAARPPGVPGLWVREPPDGHLDRAELTPPDVRVACATVAAGPGQHDQHGHDCQLAAHREVTTERPRAICAPTPARSSAGESTTA
jgi:hypothetical protein